MPKRLIVNADDFGLTPGVNRTILDLHRACAVTSATLMACGSAFADAVALARTHPSLGVGCHVVLTDGTPVSPPATIPSLLGADGLHFRSDLNSFVLDALRGKIRADDVQRETTAQILHLQAAGVQVTHLDTHKHTHVLPQILRPLLQAADATGVQAIRNPFERSWSLRLGYTRPFRLVSVAATRLFERHLLSHPAIRSGRIATTRGTIGVSATGRLDKSLLQQLVAALPEGTWELVCHPGTNDADLDQITTRLRATREIERDALLAVFSPHGGDQPRNESSSNPFDLALIHYGELLALRTP